MIADIIGVLASFFVAGLAVGLVAQLARTRI